MIKQPSNFPVTDKIWELSQDWSHEWLNEERKRWERVNIQQGYRCDMASVPRMLRNVTGVEKDGLIRGPSYIHDLIYEHKGIMPPGTFQYRLDDVWHDVQERVSRKEADLLFLQMMKEAGMSAYRRRLAYTAVRWFGRRAWNDND